MSWRKRQERLQKEVKRKNTRDLINKLVVDRTNKGKLGRDELIDIALVVEETLLRFPNAESSQHAETE